MLLKSVDSTVSDDLFAGSSILVLKQVCSRVLLTPDLQSKPRNSLLCPTLVYTE